MFQRLHILLVITVGLLTTPIIAVHADSKRNLTETDLYNFRWIADPEISPDGTHVAYTLVTVTAKHDNYNTTLWIVPVSGGAPRPLTTGNRDSNPRWSPDGKMIAFSRSVEKDSKQQPAQIFLLSMDGGEAQALTDVPKGAGEPFWSPDGRTIAFTTSTLPKDFQSKKDDAEESDVRVITRGHYRRNGAGYPDFERPGHIWTVEVPANLHALQKAKQITAGEFDEEEITWSPDSSKIYFVSDRRKNADFEPSDSDLYFVSVQGGDVTMVTSIDGEIGAPAISPDGRRIAFVGALNHDHDKLLSYSQTDLFVSNTEPNSTPRNLTVAWDFDISGSIGGDQTPPRGNRAPRPFWSADGRAVLVLGAEEGKSNLKRVDVETGKLGEITKGNQSLFAYTQTAAKIAALISTPTNIGDLYLIDSVSGESRQLTHVNEDLFSTINLTEPEMIWYRSFDGRRIQAWVQRPPDFQSGKKYPLILDIHGGPHSAYGYTFDHEFQWMAAKGYVVLYPNPRGSTTYGQEFGNIIQYNYPGDDYKDLMAGVDELISRGWVDRDKLAVTGGSGGGVLTNWTVGHTNRFKAAVSQRSIADWAGWWYTADIIVPAWFKGAPWESEADFKARSPITYIKDINTPLMLIEGEADLRTPPADGGEQMFRALSYLHKPVAMIRFPGESHELSRSGRPSHRVERLQHIVAWFDKYVQGQEIHSYDLK